MAQMVEAIMKTPLTIRIPKSDVPELTHRHKTILLYNSRPRFKSISNRQ